MKFKITLSLFVIALVGLFLIKTTGQYGANHKKLKHQAFIDKSPLQKSMGLTREERKQKALPPTKYYEQEYLLEMNPETGLTEPENIFALQERLNTDRSVPGSNGNTWVERGPNNVPGRVRAILYDPNDATHKRVFAGGVTGGLWVIDDIENSSSVWQQIDIPENLVVSSITTDVNNSNIIYIGTGEPYVGAEGTGNGVWKSTDGGATWNHIFGGSSGETTFISDALLTVNTPASIAADFSVIEAGGFGVSIPSGGVSGNLVLANDAGSADPTEGCNSFGASVSGKIAIIDRGNCNFTVKVKHAQVAGATAVIIVQSVSGFPFAMGGEDATINIPAVMISKADGDIIKNAMNANTVNVTLNPATSDLPAGIRLVPGKFHINDIVTRNNNGVTEIYAAVTESNYISNAYVVGGEFGIYKSIDGGSNWNLLTLPLTTFGNRHPINDLLITPDNKIWAGSINSSSFRNDAGDAYDGGGKIFVSTDGVNFTQKLAIPNGNRVELASSYSNANKIFAAIVVGSNTIFKKTSFGFLYGGSSMSSPANFAGQQEFYNLTLTVNPNNDNELYIGGNYVFKSTNGGASWNKITHYYNSSSPGSRMHVDVHNITFHPTNGNKGVIGNDGGVYYVNDWANAQSNSNAIQSRGNGFNTTQFYKGGIGQSTSNELFLGGAQDNGTNLIKNASNGINSSSSVGGGDGMYCFIDKDSQYMITSIYQNSYSLLDINGTYLDQIVNNQNEGDFVNVAELDDNLDILYSNASVFDTAASTWNVTISRFSNLLSSPSRTNMTDALITRPPTALKVSPYTHGSSTLFVGTDSGDIYKVTNANSTPVWTDLTPEPYDMPFLGSISSINFGANESEIMLTFHNYGVINVFYTEDGGVTWQNKEGDLPDLPVKDILMNPLLNDEVIIATDLGVWKTNNFKDANPHWTRSNDGMQNVKVTSFDLRTVDNTILASTYGRGFFTGQFTATPTVSVGDFETVNTVTTIYPTVSEGNFNIKSSKEMSNSNIQVIDINGKQVYDATMNISSTETPVSLHVESGIYFVNIINENIKESHKIIIK